MELTKEPDAGHPAKLSKKDILKFIRSAKETVGRREIARAFGIKGADRIELKQILKELAADGLIADPKRGMKRAVLPAMTVVAVKGEDANGGLIAIPRDWDESADGAPPQILLDTGKRYDGPALGIGDLVLARLKEARGQDSCDGGAFAYSGVPVKRLPREKANQLGLLRKTASGFVVESIDKKDMKEWPLAGDAAKGDASGELVRFEIIRDGGMAPASARVIERIGNPKAEKAVSLIAIQNHGLRDRFPEEVLAGLKNLPAMAAKGREDLRDIPLVTIDPVDAKDHDDAVWAASDIDPENEGGFAVIVAIADVAFYVRPGGALDREAQLRGNSVYFPDRVVPMLPEVLSNGLCSLKEGEDRPCLAVRMVFDATGKKRHHRFMRAIMRSAAKLSYQQAQAAIDGEPDGKTRKLLDPVLKPLWAAYAVLRKERGRRAPLDLDLPERKIVLDASGLVLRVDVPQRLDAHRLIEEFMIQANVAAAEALEAKKSPVIYRAHDAPSPEKLMALSEFLASLGINAAKTGFNRPGQFNRVLKQAQGTEYQELLNEVVLRSQAQADYRIANIGHFGLNLRRYAHFTSPIRRYADLIVHRALVSAFHLGEGGLGDDEKAKLGAIAEQISTLERRAMSAERETVDRLIAMHLAERVGEEFEGRISGVTRFGLFVKLDGTGADGFVPAGSLGRDYYKHVEKAHALVGERTGESYRLGDRTAVRLVDANAAAGALRFAMVSDGRHRPDLARLGRRTKGAAKATGRSSRPALRQPERKPEAGR